MNHEIAGECCLRFNPVPWDDKIITWENKRFVEDRVISFCHIPLNFDAVMKRNAKVVEAAGASPEMPVVLADENSLWGADGHRSLVNGFMLLCSSRCIGIQKSLRLQLLRLQDCGTKSF